MSKAKKQNVQKAKATSQTTAKAVAEPADRKQADTKNRKPPARRSVRLQFFAGHLSHIAGSIFDRLENYKNHKLIGPRFPNEPFSKMPKITDPKKLKSLLLADIEDLTKDIEKVYRQAGRIQKNIGNKYPSKLEEPIESVLRILYIMYGFTAPKCFRIQYSASIEIAVERWLRALKQADEYRLKLTDLSAEISYIAQTEEILDNKQDFASGSKPKSSLLTLTETDISILCQLQDDQNERSVTTKQIELKYEAERLCQDLGISLEAALRLLAGNDRREFMNLPQDVTQPPCICGDKRS